MALKDAKIIEEIREKREAAELGSAAFYTVVTPLGRGRT